MKITKRENRTLYFEEIPSVVDSNTVGELGGLQTNLPVSLTHNCGAEGAVQLDNNVIPGIVRAVNAHDDLVKACQLVNQLWQGGARTHPDVKIVLAAARAAIAKAEGGDRKP